MLDIRFIRENPELIKAAARKKRIDFKVEELLEVDKKRLELLAEVEKLRSEQNRLSRELTATRLPNRQELLDKLRQIKEEREWRDKKLTEVSRAWRQLMLLVPNVPDVSVPEGKGPDDNQEIRSHGQPPAFSFKPRSHQDLLTALRWVDLERGVKVAGFRGYFLKNELVKLNLALWQFVLDFFTARGFIPLLAPSLIKKEHFFGTGFLPQFAEDLYQVKDDFYLSGTAEVAVMGYFSDEIIPKEKLPIKIIAFSPCFRREAGSHGKDTKGLIRVHEFFKWEQVLLGEADHEQSVKYHEEITAYAEEILQELKLPYRVVVNCGGDLGLGQVKKYDLEVYLPSEERYLEVNSSSYFHDFQTRRLNIRYRDGDRLLFAHSLNNTAVATPRFLGALVENYQTKDGAVRIPEVLQRYLADNASAKKTK